MGRGAGKRKRKIKNGVLNLGRGDLSPLMVLVNLCI